VDALRVVAMCLGVLTLLVAGMARADEPGSEVRLPISVPAEADVSQVVVRPGDHLWKISAQGLRSVLGRDPGDTEISPYWRRVIEVNRDGLRSGDPDLIYPGELITLPSAPSVGQ
jgi:nucleoid-associated protein YgaU